MLKRRYFIFCCLLGILLLPLSCAKPLPQQVMQLNANLKDQSFLSVQVAISFADASGVKEAAAKSERIDHAFKLVFRDYRKEQMGAKGKGKVIRVLKRVLGTLLTHEPVKVELKAYDFREKQ